MNEHFDVVIVGGGISGLYAAWRLATQTDGPQLKVCLHECSERLGGRIDTRVVPNTDTRVELGAMRFPKSHEMLNALLQELKVATEVFPGQDFVHMYLRGKSLPLSTAPGPPQPVPDLPYRLMGSEPSHPFVLAAVALLRIVPNIQLGQPGFQLKGADPATGPQVTAAQWDEILGEVQVDGRHLWQWGFWNLLSRVVSNEAYQYLLEAFGVESAVSNWNALLALRLLCILFGDAMNGELYHPIGGWFELVDALEQMLAKLPNCKVFKRSTVTKVQKESAADAPFVLTIFEKFKNVVNESQAPAVPQSQTGTVEPPVVESTPPMRGVRLAGRQYKIEAPSLILAIPPRAMELINFEDLSAAGAAHGELPTRLAARLLDVVRVPAFRAYLTYAEPWWQQWCGWSQGYAITDLPLRQVFYGFGLSAPPPAVPPSPEVATLNATNNSRVLMASYANAATTDFWLGLMKPGVHIQQTTGNAAPDALPLQQTMNRQLKELHGYQFDFPNVEWTCVVDWTADPYGAAWHAWRPNIDVQQAIPSMRQPLFLTRLFVCGEAFSHIQGWMEGALCSAELLLEEHFNLTRATWIPEGYPLGPALPEDSTNSTTA